MYMIDRIKMIAKQLIGVDLEGETIQEVITAFEKAIESKNVEPMKTARQEKYTSKAVPAAEEK